MRGLIMDLSIRINSKHYNSIEEFAHEIYLFHDEAFSLIKSQKFLKILYKYNEKMYNDIVELLTQPFQQDASTECDLFACGCISACNLVQLG